MTQGDVFYLKHVIALALHMVLPFTRNINDEVRHQFLSLVAAEGSLEMGSSLFTPKEKIDAQAQGGSGIEGKEQPSVEPCYSYNVPTRNIPP